MKFFRLDLLTLLISLFILNSCKNQGTVGLGLNPSAQLNGALVDSATILTNTVLDDTVATTGLAKTPLAYFNDPVFGLTESSIASDLNLPSSAAYTPPTGTIVIDSARLVLQYADGFYGDSTASSYTVNVFQLKEKYNSNSTYYNKKQWNYDQNALLGSLTFNSRTHTTIKIYNIIVGKPDTLIKAVPQIRIPISTNFVNSNLFSASSTTLANNSLFQNAVKGLYITLDKTKTTGPGGVFMIKSDTLAVYYRANNGTTIDTNMVKLPITRMAAQVNHTYSATIQAELNNTFSSRGTVYLEGLAGLRAKISFPNLLVNLRNNLLKKDSDIVLNRAELVVTPVAGSDIPYKPSPKLTMYRLDLAHQRMPVEDANPGDARSGGVAVFGGYYNPTLKNYHFIVTAYLQDLLSNKTVDYGTFIAPIDTTKTSGAPSLDYSPSIQAGSRVVAGGGANPTSPYRIKLNIIYTKVHR
ncbi:MAG TPA: DUF4270 family protein [Mucilaginibacter sp.]|jgi:hypothetical protein|nr:DUF4270 family protein [Mucilaginibacter sp.]